MLKSAGFHFWAALSHEMNYAKPALLYQEQIQLLTSRNLICNDESRAMAWLQRIGYYRLSAYFIPFRVPGTDIFQKGASLDEIVGLYEFDSGLRLLTMQAIDRIEVAVRAIVTYHLAHSLGVFGYADPTNFKPSFDHVRFLKQLKQEEQRSSEAFVAAYRAKYTSEKHLPVWMATELISFGALSHMYANLRKQQQKHIARQFGQRGPIFVSWLHTLTAIRNICAHHGRLWNRELAIKPELPNAWKDRGILNHRFYGVALIIQTLMAEISPESRWKDRLQTHLDSYPAIDLGRMLFPADWRRSSPWV
jgi:abortive infection bacteriophage resistance protein